MKKVLVLGCVAAAVLAALGIYAWASGAEADAAPDEEGEIAAAETIYGKIKEINGNEMLLAIGVMESAGDTPGSGGVPGAPEADAQTGGDTPDDAPSRETPDRGGAMDDAGEQPGTEAAGQRGQGSGEGRGAPDGASGQGGPPAMEGGGPGGARQQGGRPGGQTSIRLTGEEITCLIPVTCTITSGQGNSAQTVRFTQLAVKNVVKLSLDADGAILSIQVLQ